MVGHIIRELPFSPEVMLSFLRVGGLLGGDIYGFGRVLFLLFILGVELGIVGFFAFVDGYGGQFVALLVRHGSLAVLGLGVVHGGDAVAGTHTEIL